MAWLRLDEHVPENNKAMGLPGELFKFWIIALCIAKESEGKFTDLNRASFRFRMPESRVIVNLEKLRRAELVDLVEGVYQMHDWDEWQYKSDVSTERVKQFRKRMSNGNETVPRNGSETFHGTVSLIPPSSPPCIPPFIPPQISETETDSPPTPSHGKNGTGYDPQLGWDWFLATYPKHRLNAHQDCRLWLSIVEDAYVEGVIREKLPLFKRSAEWRRGVIPSARKFLSDRLFVMEPPPEAEGTATQKSTKGGGYVTSAEWERLYGEKESA